jgi:uncharacterized protein
MVGVAGEFDAARLFAASRPRHRDVHLFRSGAEAHALLPDGNRLFAIDDATYQELGAGLVDGTIGARLSALELQPVNLIGDEAPVDPPTRSLSLAVAQRCNLGCSYCYADGGDFGGPAKSMPLDTALASVDLLFAEAVPGEPVHIAYLGGEPLMARDVIHRTTARAAQLSAEHAVPVTFAITTNGTLVRPDDGAFFEEHGFAVTVSLDGPQPVHDLLRPTRNNRGTFDRILANVAPLLATQRRMQVSARVTVTPLNLDLRETLDRFVELGFFSVGFSPLLRSPSGTGELGHPELRMMLDAMVGCGLEFERRVVAGRRYPFANAVNALREIHRGTHRPYPCGAGAGYLGVSADGELAACHRFVGDDNAAMGTVTDGVDRQRQRQWLELRHVHRQDPCSGCWARYLCGGGCHHEVIARGRPACDYIRGWLQYCLGAYSRLVEARPDYFGIG